MRQLIEAIRTRDFSLQYSLDHLRGEERNLAEQINEVVNEFRENTLQQEAKYQYFGTMLDTINAFLIVADEQGKVHWMNRAAVDGLCGFSIHHLHDLQVLDETLPEMMMQLKPGLQKLVQLETKISEGAAGKKAWDAGNQHAGKADFVLSVVNFFNKGFAYRLYTLQNVQPVIQKNETDAQQQLVRVLTHEIMNSLTPIISLADTLCEGVEQGGLGLCGSATDAHGERILFIDGHQMEGRDVHHDVFFVLLRIVFQSPSCPLHVAEQLGLPVFRALS